MDLFDIFGITEEELKDEKKASAKPKKKEKKEKKEKKQGTNYKLPVSFCAGHLRQIFYDEAAGTWSEDTLKKNIRSTFRELAGIFFKISVMNVEEKEEGIETYIRPEIMYKEFTNEDKLEFPLEVTAGTESLWLDTKMSLDEIRALWVEAHPEYDGCRFQYDEKQKLLIPFMERNAPGGKKYTFPVTVGYLGIQETYGEEDFGVSEVTEAELQQKFASHYPEFSECGFAYIEEQNHLFPVMKSGQEEKDKSIAIPVEVRASGFSLTINPEDIQGKRSATLEEIREVLEGVYPEYTKDRTDMQYDQRHFVVPVLISSRKGLEIRPLNPGWKHEIIEDEYQDKWRVETTPFGVFRCNSSKKDQAAFQLSAHKIPRRILEDVIRIFKKTPALEHALQIFYDNSKDSYILFEPEQCVTKGSVKFKRDLQMEQKYILVMDIHSHGMYSAFFSSVDNEDEKGIRLYMVFGNLDRHTPGYALRVGVAGIFGEVALEDIFEGRSEA